MIRPSKHLPLGPLIEKILVERGMTKADFGRRINCSRQNVSLILKKEHIDTQLLWRICDVIDTDLFGLMSQTFDADHPYDLGGNGTMEIRLQLTDTKLVQITADLVRGIMQKAQ